MAGSNPGPASTSTPAEPKRGGRRTGRTRVTLAIVVAVAASAAFLIYWATRPTHVELDVIENWLAGQQYTMFRPFRGDMEPGTIVVVDGQGEQLAVRAESLGIAAQPNVSSIDLTWSVRQSLSGEGVVRLPGLSSASLKGMGVADVSLTLRDLRTRTAPLHELDVAVKRFMEGVGEGLSKDRPYLVISEVIEARSLEMVFTGADGAEIDLAAELKESNIGVSGAFEVQVGGRIRSKTPLTLGYRGRSITVEGNTLDPTDRGRRVRVAQTPLTWSELTTLRQELPAPRKLASDYQVFALCIGLGNYASTGMMSGAAQSAVHTAEQFQPLAGGEPGRVQVRLSAMAADAFVPGRFRTKEDLVGWIEAFVDENQPRVPSDRPSIAIVYFCGHGLATGLNRWAYLVPEDVAFSEDQQASDLEEQLLSIAEVLEALEGLADRKLVLVDSCRSHDRDDEQLLEIWSGPLGQDEQNLSGILDVLSFTSGLTGPHPVMFSSEDGKPAELVPAVWSSDLVGPMAVRLDQVLTTARLYGRAMTLEQFVKAMQQPTNSRLVDGKRIAGYTKLRADFLAELGDAKFLAPAVGR